MDIQTLNSLKTKFVTREVGNELILVPLSGNVAQMNELFTLNETGKFIWENSDEQTSVEDIVNLMTDEFAINAATARKDLENFLNQIKSTFAKL